jgi:hypothetical protein
VHARDPGSGAVGYERCGRPFASGRIERAGRPVVTWLLRAWNGSSVTGVEARKRRIREHSACAAKRCTVLVTMRDFLARGAFLLGIGATLLGCSTTSGRLKARFAREQSCPADQVGVVEEGAMVYRATGCGKQTEYVCGTFASMDSGNNCSIRDLNGREPPGNPPPKNTSRPDYDSPK